MEQGKRRKYDREFKVEAVKLVTGGGRAVTEVARNLGIHENLLYKWREKYSEDTRTNLFQLNHSFSGSTR